MADFKVDSYATNWSDRPNPYGGHGGHIDTFMPAETREQIDSTSQKLGHDSADWGAKLREFNQDSYNNGIQEDKMGNGDKIVQNTLNALEVIWDPSKDTQTNIENMGKFADLAQNGTAEEVGQFIDQFGDRKNLSDEELQEIGGLQAHMNGLHGFGGVKGDAFGMVLGHALTPNTNAADGTELNTRGFYNDQGQALQADEVTIQAAVDKAFNTFELTGVGSEQIVA
jgi:hypothetical protein